MKYLLTLLLVLGGCTTTEVTTPIVTNGVYYQAFDENWADTPFIHPAFDTKSEAESYAEYNNRGRHHSYEVREIDYRYEVRIVNPTTNEILHTTNEFNDAYEYVIEYSSAHADLIIYDLKTGKSYEETP